jgi:hypothetical protein
MTRLASRWSIACLAAHRGSRRRNRNPRVLHESRVLRTRPCLVGGDNHTSRAGLFEVTASLLRNLQRVVMMGSGYEPVRVRATQDIRVIYQGDGCTGTAGRWFSKPTGI